MIEILLYAEIRYNLEIWTSSYLATCKPTEVT